MTRPILKLPHIKLQHYMLVFILAVLMLAPACGRRGDLYLPSETQDKPQPAAPATPLTLPLSL